MELRKCPQCSSKLTPVVNSNNSMLNNDQFDSIRAGDCYCSKCPNNNRGKSGLCYWWENEVPKNN